MPVDHYAARRKKLLQALRRKGLGTLLVTDFTNVTYLTGFSGDDSYLLVGPELTVLISDSRYTTQIKEECPGLDVFVRSNRQPIIESVSRVVGRAKLQNLAFESGSVTHAQWEQIQSAVKSLELQPVTGLIETQREVKDRHEIAEIEMAVTQAERGFEVLRASLVGSMSELEAAHDLEHTMRRFGAHSAAFEPIVAAGPRAALPHAHPTGARIGSSEFLLVDWGARTISGYRSDLTRVLVTGKILPKLEKIYKVVLRAQRRAIKSIRPGASGRDVDAAARTVIENAGYGKNFGHGLGHGVGLDIHEGPRLSPISESVLQPGMVITVEPGIYLPGWGGVRIEDDVLVTRDGHRVLTSVVKEFEQIVLS